MEYIPSSNNPKQNYAPGLAETSTGNLFFRDSFVHARNKITLALSAQVGSCLTFEYTHLSNVGAILDVHGCINNLLLRGSLAGGTWLRLFTGELHSLLSNDTTLKAT